MKCLLESLLFCAQGIALRGHQETNLEDLCINVGNFRSLMVLQSRHDDVVKQRLKGHVTHHGLVMRFKMNCFLQWLSGYY